MSEACSICGYERTMQRCWRLTCPENGGTGHGLAMMRRGEFYIGGGDYGSRSEVPPVRREGNAEAELGHREGMQPMPRQGQGGANRAEDTPVIEPIMPGFEHIPPEARTAEEANANPIVRETLTRAEVEQRYGVPIGEKVRHVREAAFERGHTCHWPGCRLEVKPAVWGCMMHWKMLPQHLRNEIWSVYRPGQEQSKSPSREYVDVARRVQAWIMENHPPAPDRQGSLL